VDDRVERKLGVCGFEEQLLLSVTRNHAPPGKRLAAQPSLPNTNTSLRRTNQKKVAESGRDDRHWLQFMVRRLGPKNMYEASRLLS
jgi:hypothetical protein